MTVSKDNKRVIITMPKDLHDRVQKLADEENRSISNYIITVVKQKIEKDDMAKK